MLKKGERSADKKHGKLRDRATWYISKTLYSSYFISAKLILIYTNQYSSTHMSDSENRTVLSPTATVGVKVMLMTSE